MKLNIDNFDYLYFKEILINETENETRKAAHQRDLMIANGVFGEIQKIADLFDNCEVHYSTKSMSTYFTFSISRYNEIIKILQENNVKFDTDYYDMMCEEDLEELDSFKVRVSDHSVGSHFSEYTNESVSYSDEGIQIIIQY